MSRYLRTTPSPHHPRQPQHQENRANSNNADAMELDLLGTGTMPLKYYIFLLFLRKYNDVTTFFERTLKK